MNGRNKTGVGAVPHVVCLNYQNRHDKLPETLMALNIREDSKRKYGSIQLVYLLQRVPPCCLTVPREPGFNTGSVPSLFRV